MHRKVFRYTMEYNGRTSNKSGRKKSKNPVKVKRDNAHQETYLFSDKETPLHKGGSLDPPVTHTDVSTYVRIHRQQCK